MPEKLTIILSAEGREDMTISVDNPQCRLPNGKSVGLGMLMDRIIVNDVVGEPIRLQFHTSKS